jgi:cytoskeletal protein RodZ
MAPRVKAPAEETPPVQIPQEVQNYYDAENRDHAGKAWLLAILTFVGAALIVLALFFTGRWAYHTIRDHTKKKNPVATQTTKGGTKAPSVDGGSTEKPNSSTTPPPSSSNASGSTSTGNTSSGSSSSSSTPSASTTPPSGALPNTGPGDITAIVSAVSIGGVLAHQAYTRRRNVRI